MKPLAALYARAARKERRAEIKRAAVEILFVMIGIPLFGIILGILAWSLTETP